MALIDALIDRVGDEALRSALREQVDTLLGKHSFGLVFQDHRPETVELPNYRVARGCKVRRRDGGPELFRVRKVLKGVATLVGDGSDETVDEATSNLIVVREFGEAIYPGLQSLGRIDADPSKPFHSVINAENFHALETLLYTCEEKVDAIYIDPHTTPGHETGSTTTTTSTASMSTGTASGWPSWSAA